MNSNRFARLDQVTTKYNTPPSIKKAMKKLREIEVLEGKSNLSPDEQIKLSEKPYWEIIANIKQKAEAKKVNERDTKRKQEKKERHIKLEQERKKQKDRERQAKEEKEQYIKLEQERKNRERQAKEEKEYEERKRKQKEKRERINEEKESYIKKYKELKEILLEQKLLYISITHEDLEIEWAVSLRYIYNNNVLKTFRHMSVKYHPDKCKWGNDILQKHLGHLRDVYLK